jgi:hypothetical protein
VSFEVYLNKVLKELAIFRHFYHLSRKNALRLPVWEWENLLSEYERIQTENSLRNLISVNGGFNGGEEVKEMIDKWQKKINEGFEVIDKPKKVTEWDEEELEKFDNFLSSFGL